ncbi:MAG: hypothetical protein ACK5HL_03925 [Bacilli bacterium]
MTNKTKTLIFLSFTLFSKTLIEPFTIIFLNDKGYNSRLILIYFLSRYILSFFILRLFPKLENKFKHISLLLISNILLCISFVFLKYSDNSILNLGIFSILQTIYTYLYILAKNRYIFTFLDTKHSKDSAKLIIIVSSIAVIPTSLIGAFVLDIFSINVLIGTSFIISLLGLIPLFLINEKIENTNENIQNILKGIDYHNKILLFLDQGKLIFISILPLYIFNEVKDSFEYIGFFNLIIGITSVIATYFITNKIDKKKDLLAISSILLTLIITLKLSINQPYLFLIFALIEGIIFKIHDFSMIRNIFVLSSSHETFSYNLALEYFYNISRCILMFIFIFIGNIKIILYICIFLIFGEAFLKFRYQKNKSMI